jgi:hypothetical protein
MFLSLLWVLPTSGEGSDLPCGRVGGDCSMQLHSPVRCFETNFEIDFEIHYEIHFQNAFAIY